MIAKAMIEAFKRRRYVLIALAVIIAGFCLAAQTPRQLAMVNSYAMPIGVDRGAAGLSRLLASLRTRASIMAVWRIPTTKMAACWHSKRVAVELAAF